MGSRVVYLATGAELSEEPRLVSLAKTLTLLGYFARQPPVLSVGEMAPEVITLSY